MKKNTLVDIDIKESEYPNMSIGEYDGKTIKFKGGIKGQNVSVRIQRKKGDYYQAKLIEINEKSKLENNKTCPMFDVCGGCKYQSLNYESELIYKLDQLKKLYRENGLDEGLLSINRAPSSKAYRNKMEYTFGDEYKDGPLTLGLHKRNRFYEIVNTEGCNIVHEDFEKIRLRAMEFFQENEIDFYHKKRQKGFLKFMVVRKSITHGDLLINLVTTSEDVMTYGLWSKFVEALVDLDTEGRTVSIFHTISDSLADAIVPDYTELIWGREYIVETINDLDFRIGPFSFFQPNPLGAENLYKKALEYAGDIENKTVYDLYCGTGTISQIFAKKAKKVIGVEIVEEAVNKAMENAKINELDNVEFICNDVMLEIGNLEKNADILVLDPPREGIHPKAIDSIVGIKAPIVVYISCNPKTLVRDLQIFKEAGYEIEKSTAYDQFPRTAHVEAVTRLVKVK